MKQCLYCKNPILPNVIDFGPQPICNRFLQNPDQMEFTHPMTMGICGSCGVVQLLNPAPIEKLMPTFDWITYNEPEAHLDGLVETIIKKLSLTKSSVIGGVTFKDDSILRRLREKGVEHVWRLNPLDDLGVDDPRAGIETIQSKLTPEVCRNIALKRGQADLVIARHVFEHFYNPIDFIHGAFQLLTPDGSLLLEVPDCGRALNEGDVTTLWEEHITYFTQGTFQESLRQAGLDVWYFQMFPYTLENSLVALIRRSKGEAPARVKPPSFVHREVEVFHSYKENLPVRKQRVTAYLSNFRASRGPVALLGAGHLGCTFVNLLQLKNQIDVVVDDNPLKKNLLMPGSKLPVRPTSVLLEKGVKLCLMTVSPENEIKVFDKQKGFLENGGKLASIFPGSSYALEGAMVS